jgi:hypothetical protein
MKTVPFSAILAESCQLIGLDRNTLNDKSFAAIRDFTNRRLSMIWDREDWPDIQQIVQVWPGIPIANVESTVAIATESGVDILQENGETILSEGEDVMIDVTITLNTNYPRIYLRDFAEQAWQKGTIGQTEIHIINPFFVIQNDGSLVAADFSKYNFTYTTADDATDPYITSVTFNVPWCLPQWTPISGSTLQFVKNPQPITVVSGQAIGCWGGDPRKTSRMSNESFVVENMPDIDLAVSSSVQTFSQDLFVLRFANFGTKFVLLRANAPFLFGTRYDATLAYSTGSQVYYDPSQASSAYNPPNKNLQVAGNFWNAIAPAAIGVLPANPSFSWSLMAIPFRFKGYLVNSVAADFMRSEGRPTEADSLEAMAEFAVQQQIDVLIRQQGQIKRMNMVYTY